MNEPVADMFPDMSSAESPAEAQISPYVTLYGAPEGQDARALAARARELADKGGVLIFAALDDVRLSAMEEMIGFFDPDARIALFPAWDCLPYDRVSPHGDIVADRVATLSTLLDWQAEKARAPRILLTTINALTQRVMPPAALSGTSLSVRKGGRVDIVLMRNFLAGNGYSRVDTVREAGEFAMRGGIVDLFPPGHDAPLRIDLFGDEVESIRAFDPDTQRTDTPVDDFVDRIRAEVLAKA